MESRTGVWEGITSNCGVTDFTGSAKINGEVSFKATSVTQRRRHMSEEPKSEVANLPEPIVRKEAQQSGWLNALKPNNVAKMARAIGRITGASARLSNTVSQTLRENKGRDIVQEAVANRIAAGIINQDPQYERAFQREADRLLGEQRNLEDIAELAMDELGMKTEKDFKPGDVEEDWLYQFEQAAKGFTSDRMKHTFARLLSGEILKPGSFSPATLRTVATMSTKDANLIVRFLSLAYSPSIPDVPKAIFSPMLLTAGMSPGNNGLSKFGLSYGDLSTLQQCGFLNYDLSTHRNVVEALLLGTNSQIGNQLFRFIPFGDKDRPKEMQLQGLLLTNVGEEISGIVETEAPDEDYIVALRAQMEKKHSLSLVALTAE